MTKTKELSLGAMGCALSFLFLLGCSLIPTGKLVMGFLASFVPCVLYIESKSLKTPLLSGISSALLAGLILPKSGLGGLVIIMYCTCLCYYPILKAIIERLRNLAFEWILKVIYFVVLTLAIKLITKALGIDIFNIWAGIIALCAYDYLLSSLIGYYTRFISPRIKKSR